MFDAGAETGTVNVYWSTPLERVNGDALPFDEIGGYEIRYRSGQSIAYSFVTIFDPSVEQYTIDDIRLDNLVIEVAVFDNQANFSSYVKATE